MHEVKRKTTHHQDSTVDRLVCSEHSAQAVSQGGGSHIGGVDGVGGVLESIHVGQHPVPGGHHLVSVHRDAGIAVAGSADESGGVVIDWCDSTCKALEKFIVEGGSGLPSGNDHLASPQDVTAQSLSVVHQQVVRKVIGVPEQQLVVSQYIKRRHALSGHVPLGIGDGLQGRVVEAVHHGVVRADVAAVSISGFVYHQQSVVEAKALRRGAHPR